MVPDLEQHGFELKDIVFRRHGDHIVFIILRRMELH